MTKTSYLQDRQYMYNAT